MLKLVRVDERLLHANVNTYIQDVPGEKKTPIDFE